MHGFTFPIELIMASMIQYSLSAMSGINKIMIKHVIDEQEQINYACEQLSRNSKLSVIALFTLSFYFYIKYDFFEALLCFILNLIIIHIIYNDLCNEIINNIIKNNLKVPECLKNNLLLELIIY
jgi:hypothetical protein